MKRIYGYGILSLLFLICFTSTAFAGPHHPHDLVGCWEGTATAVAKGDVNGDDGYREGVFFSIQITYQSGIMFRGRIVEDIFSSEPAGTENDLVGIFLDNHEISMSSNFGIISAKVHSRRGKMKGRFNNIDSTNPGSYPNVGKFKLQYMGPDPCYPPEIPDDDPYAGLPQ